MDGLILEELSSCFCHMNELCRVSLGKSFLVKYQTLSAPFSIFIGPESDHWLSLSLTNWLTDSLTNCRLVDLIDLSLACEDGISKLVEVVDDEKQFTP